MYEVTGNTANFILYVAWIAPGYIAAWQLHFTVCHDRFLFRDMVTHRRFSHSLNLRDSAGVFFCVYQIDAANIVIFYVCRISLYNGEL